MTYTLGALHDLLAGSGSISVANPAGLLLTVLGYPIGVGVQPGTPQTLHRLGHITPGDSHGWFARIPIVQTQQLVLPCPPDLTLVGYDLVYGAGLSIRELVGGVVVPANIELNPWDRNPVPIIRSAFGGIGGGTALTTAWSYTVPTGKKLWLSTARTSVQRTVAATAAVNAQAYITLDGVMLAQAVTQSNVIGFLLQDGGPGAGMIVPAGGVLAGVYQNSDTGGTVVVQVALSAYVFDA